MKKSPSIDFKKELNPSQWDAVASIDGPVLVVAGAGTGKTRVIEYRCLYMIEKGIPAESILLLTFTRKAAREMLGRAAGHDVQCRKIEGGTFHSFAYRIIKKYKRTIGLEGALSFIDESDSADVLHLLSSRLGFLEEKTRFPKKDTLRNVLSMSINRDKSIRDVLSCDYPQFVHLSLQLEELQKKYAEYKIKRNLIDYDDMLIYLKFLLENEEINKQVSSQFRYIMVDEFQDTNKIQAEIVYSLAKNHHNCMAVGDDTQSIYSFRGAYYKNMFDFPNRLPNAKIIKLEYNYRSIQPILDVANAVIEEARHKYSKVLFTTKTGDEKPTLAYFKDAYTEAEGVADKIQEYHTKGCSLASLCVLYRSNYMSLPLQLELSKRNIPFAVYGGMKFIETAHIKDVLAFLKAHHNPSDDISWGRILMLLDGVGPKTAEKIRNIVSQSKAPEVNAFLNEAVKNIQIQKDVRRLIALFDALRDTKEIQRKIKKIIQFYKPFLKQKFDDFLLREEDLKALQEISSSYLSLEQFLVDFVTLEPPERSVVDIEGKKEDERPVTLSTIHSAKGLEWDVVFIVALIDGCLPVSYALENEESIEEERRLLYVAATRAKRHLHLSMHNEGRNGGVNSFNRLSRFVSDPRVMDKLTTAYAWFEENPIDDEDSFVKNKMDKQGLYHRLVDYFDSHEQNYF